MGERVKAYLLVISTLLINLAAGEVALPARADATAATAGQVQQLQQLGQRFPQPSASPQASPPILPQYETDTDDHGQISTYQPNGATVTASNSFFKILGTNGRTCFTCHQPQNGWGLSSDGASQRFAANPNEPLFRLIDGATCPSDDVSTPAAMAQAYSLLTGKGLIRIGLPMQSSLQFQIENVQDAYGNCNTNPITGLTGSQSGFLSFYRRPLPATNLGYLSSIMWDGREPSLFHQAIDATLGHAQATNAPQTSHQNQIVSFEGCTYALTPQNCANIQKGEGLFTAQSADNNAGDLTANGATGGPTYLYPQLTNYSLCSNDPFGCNGQSFNPAIFNVYDAWAKLTGTDPQTQAKLALYRGEQVFNTVKFKITSVTGINDVQKKNSITGTCGTCHNTPNTGNHSSNLALNIGVTGAGPNAPPDLDISGLPVFTVVCTSGPLAGKTFQVTDLGVAMISGQCADIGKTKVPIIRGIAGRSPYFHNGAAPEITNLIDFYDQRFSIGLTDQQKADLAVFLESL